MSPLPQASTWSQLDVPRALQQLGDSDALYSMLPMLQEMLERDLPQINRLLADLDVRSASQLLHALKGCMPIFCTPALCEHLAQVEVLSKTGQATEVSAAYASLRPKLEQLQQEIAACLAQAAG